MELRVLQYFLAVSREQSIVRAAESPHLSQPTLSTQIKTMEEELGKQLLIRGVCHSVMGLIVIPNYRLSYINTGIPMK